MNFWTEKGEMFSVTDIKEIRRNCHGNAVIQMKDTKFSHFDTMPGSCFILSEPDYLKLLAIINPGSLFLEPQPHTQEGN